MGACYDRITLTSREATPGCLAFSPCGKFLASYSIGHPLLFSSCADGHTVTDVQVPGRITVLAWNPSQKRELICGFENGTVTLLQLTNNLV